MHVSREELDSELLKLIRMYSDRNMQQDIINKLEKIGFMQGEVRDLLDNRIAPTMLDEIVLYQYFKVIYDLMKNENSNPKKYFTESEILIADKYIKDQDTTFETYPIVFDNMLRVGKDQWIGVISIKKIASLYRSGLIIYNPKTQREAKKIKVGNTIIKEIFTNPESIRAIKELLLSGMYVSNELTFNIEKTGEEEIDPDEKNNKLIIRSGKISITDGYHRSSAILAALRENPELDYNFELRITRHDIEKANRYIKQQNKRNPISEAHTKRNDPDRLANDIVDFLDSKKSYLKGKITEEYINSEKNIIFNDLSDIIEMVFCPKTQRDMLKISNFLSKNINLVIYNNLDILDEQDQIVLFAIIVALGDVYNSNTEVSEELISELINSINFEYIKTIKYNKINSTLIKRIKKGMNLLCLKK